MKQLCVDLTKEHEALDKIVADIDDAKWNIPTPAEGWSVKDQISHLAFFDDKARLSATDPEAFNKDIQEIMKDPLSFMGQDLRTGQKMSNSELMEWWRKERKILIEAVEPLDPKTRVPWYGPPMSLKSFISARLMETWAHGQDVVDALAADRPATDRLRHVAHLCVTAFKWSYSNRKMDVPDVPVYVELVSPSGDIWKWGPDDAANIVRGTAEDFCLVACQRRHVDDTDIEAVGDIAKEWMLIAQAFAGPPTDGRKPGSFPKKNK